MPLLKTLTENETLNFINKEELEENSIYSLNQKKLPFATGYNLLI